MKSVSKYLIIIVAIIGMAKELPDLYWTIFSQKTYSTNAAFSAVLQDYVFVSWEKDGARYYDNSGNEYENKEFIALLPFQNYNTLTKIGKAPEVVNGQEVTRVALYQEKTSFHLSPSSINGLDHYIDLHQLFESVNELGKIESPDEFFRISDRMEFLDPDTNSIIEEKTALFTNALSEKGFQFPSTAIFGNEDGRKPFDFGYFIIDNAGKVFHLIQVEGQPVVNKLNLDVDGTIVYMSIKEQSLPIYGFVVTDKGNVYQLSRDNYSLQKAYIESYDPFTESLSYTMDLQNITVKISDSDKTTSYTSDRLGNPVGTVVVEKMQRIRGQSKAAYDIIFPYTIDGNSFTKSYLPIVHFSENFKYAMGFSVILAALFVAVRRRQTNVAEVGFIVIGGIYSLLALVVLLIAIRFSK